MLRSVTQDRDELMLWRRLRKASLEPLEASDGFQCQEEADESRKHAAKADRSSGRVKRTKRAASRLLPRLLFE